MTVKVEVRQKALDALVIMNTAVKNVRLYPPTSSIIVSTINRLHQSLEFIFRTEQSLIIAESEKNILIYGEPLSPRDHDKMQIVALLEILLNFNVKSIAFNKGLEKEELIILLEYLSKNPEIVKSEGGLAQCLADKNLTHIQIDERVYVVRKKSQQILSSLDISDDQILQFLSLLHPESDPERLQEMAKDPEWILQAFENGLFQAEAQKGTLSNVELTESLTSMMTLLDKVAQPLDNKDQERISQGIGKSIATIDPEMAKQVLSQNIENLFGGMLMKYIASELREVPPDGLSPANINASAGGGPSSGAAGGSIFADNQPLYLEERLELLLKDTKRAVLSEPLMDALPKIVEKLIAQKQQEAMETIISRLMENIFDEDIKVRDQSATALVEIMNSLPERQKLELMEKLSGRLLDWIKIETLATPAYRKIVDNLRTLVEELIYLGHFTEAMPILDLFCDIRAGNLEKNDTIHDISFEFIRALATEDRLNFLFNIYNNEQDKQQGAGVILVRLGDVALNRLLDLLHENVDSNERVRIMRLIIGIGSRAIPFVRDRINNNAAWYYLRNMAYILGHIGNESSASALQPLLLHENSKVRLETLKSISRTGGSERCSMLLSVLPEADDQFKPHVIEALGNAKCADAVPDLLDRLKGGKTVKDKTLRTNLEEKICTALGAIGSPEAIPALSDIIEAKSFLGIKSYPEAVKLAAGKALISIKKKLEKTGKTGY